MNLAGEGVEHGYFSGASSGETEAEVDSRFNRDYEAPFNQLLPAIDTGLNVLDEPGNRKIAARYVAHMFNRTRARRAGGEALLKEMLSRQRDITETPQHLRLYAAKMSLIARRAVTLDEVQKALISSAAELATTASLQTRYVDDLDRATAGLAARLEALRWSVLRSDSAEPFVISDTPIVSFSRDVFGQIRYGLGIGRETAEWFLPISGGRIMRISHRRGASGLINEGLVTELNLAQIFTMSSRVYSRSYSAWINDRIQTHGGVYKFHRDVFKGPPADPSEDFEL